MLKPSGVSPRARTHGLKVAKKKPKKTKPSHPASKSKTKSADDVASSILSRSLSSENDYITQSSLNYHTQTITSDISFLKEQLSNSLREIAAQNVRQQIDLEDRLRLEKEKADLHEQLQDTKRRLQETGKALQKVHQSTTQLMSTRDQREVQLQASIESNKALKNRIEQLETDIFQAESKSTSQSTVNNYKQLLMEKELTIQGLEDQIMQLKSAAAKTRREIMELQEEKVEIERSYTMEKGKIEQLSRDNNTLKMNVEAAHHNTALKSEQVFRLERQITELKKSMIPPKTFDKGTITEHNEVKKHNQSTSTDNVLLIQKEIQVDEPDHNQIKLEEILKDQQERMAEMEKQYQTQQQQILEELMQMRQKKEADSLSLYDDVSDDSSTEIENSRNNRKGRKKGKGGKKDETDNEEDLEEIINQKVNEKLSVFSATLQEKDNTVKTLEDKLSEADSKLTNSNRLISQLEEGKSAVQHNLDMLQLRLQRLELEKIESPPKTEKTSNPKDSMERVNKLLEEKVITLMEEKRSFELQLSSFERILRENSMRQFIQPSLSTSSLGYGSPALTPHGYHGGHGEYFVPVMQPTNQKKTKSYSKDFTNGKQKKGRKETSTEGSEKGSPSEDIGFKTQQEHDKELAVDNRVERVKALDSKHIDNSTNPSSRENAIFYSTYNKETPDRISKTRSVSSDAEGLKYFSSQITDKSPADKDKTMIGQYKPHENPIESPKTEVRSGVNSFNFASENGDSNSELIEKSENKPSLPRDSEVSTASFEPFSDDPALANTSSDVRASFSRASRTRKSQSRDSESALKKIESQIDVVSSDFELEEEKQNEPYKGLIADRHKKEKDSTTELSEVPVDSMVSVKLGDLKKDVQDSIVLQKQRKRQINEFEQKFFEEHGKKPDRDDRKKLAKSMYTTYKQGSRELKRKTAHLAGLSTASHPSASMKMIMKEANDDESDDEDGFGNS